MNKNTKSYQLMQACWHDDPQKRLTFASIVDNLEVISDTYTIIFN